MDLAFSGINYLAVVAGAVATMITGMIWYSPGTPTGKTWMKLAGVKMDGSNNDNMAVLYGSQFVASLVMSFFLAVIVNTLGITVIGSGLMIGFWLWLGLIAASCAGVYIFPPKPVSLFVLDNIYKLINVLIILAIVIAWK